MPYGSGVPNLSRAASFSSITGNYRAVEQLGGLEPSNVITVLEHYVMWRNAARRLSGAAAGMATAAGSAHVSSSAAAALRSGAVASASAPSVVARDLRCFKDSGSLLGAPNRSRRFGYYRNDYRPPPPNNYRRAPPALPNMEGERMLWSIMGANAFVFACWHALDPRLMQQNFLVSEESVYAGRVHTIVTSAFSHYNLGHLGANMLALYYFGRDLSRIFGPKYLLNLYLAGGIAASATHVAWCRWERERRQSRRRGFIAQRAGRWMENTAGYLTTPPALGASGAVNAIVLLNALVFPTNTIYLNFFIPMPNWLFAALFLSRDLYGAQLGLGGSSTGHAAHLGGAGVGAAAWAWMRYGRFIRR